ncbi:MAG: hypothetical protein ACTTH0_02295 [Eubacteriales bacterium]
MTIFKKLICLLTVLLVFAFAGGCDFQKKSGSTVIEPDITSEYLESEYSEQLMRDGAEYLFGNISLKKLQDGQIEVTVSAKELVEDYEGKMLIENRNFEISYVLPQEARCTFRKGIDSKSAPDILTGEKFLKAYEKTIKGMTLEQKKNYDNSQYYKIYILNDQIELLLNERIEI